MFPASWNLTCNPFAAAGLMGRFYVGTPQQEALARLRYLTAGQRRLGLLTAGPGLGKSTLLHHFARDQRRTMRGVTELHAGGLTGSDLFWQLAADLSLSPRSDESAPRLFRRLADFATTFPLQREQALLLLDDADQAGPDLWNHLIRLIHIAPTAGWLTVIVGANFLHATPAYRRVLETAEMQVDLERWSADETTAYVRDALQQAGGDGTLFSEEAYEQIYRCSEGSPREVNRLAEQALLAAAVDQSPQVAPEQVVQAAAEAILTARSSRQQAAPLRTEPASSQPLSTHSS